MCSQENVNPNNAGEKPARKSLEPQVKDSNPISFVTRTKTTKMTNQHEAVAVRATRAGAKEGQSDQEPNKT